MSITKRCLGLDIGGANLKAATTDGFAREVAFPLWKQPNQLANALAGLIAEAPPHAEIAATMTGELADCYATKAEGVAAIVEATVEAASGVPVRIYSMKTGFSSPSKAVGDWEAVAAANWHALGRATSEYGVLADIGSTTTDIIVDRSPPRTDTERLLAGQLLYFGVGRTPLCALLDALPYRGRMCPVAAELFATTADVSLLLDYRAESDSTETADGRPLTKANSVARIGRMICADATQFAHDDALTAARHVCGVMEKRIVAAIDKQIGESRPPRRFVISGGGAWLARAALLRAGYSDGVTALADVIGADAARCAPAWAVAKLAEEWRGT